MFTFSTMRVDDIPFSSTPIISYIMHKRKQIINNVVKTKGTPHPKQLCQCGFCRWKNSKIRAARS